MTDMRIVTWNVNSLNARMDRVTEWLPQLQPDVLCMQETKMSNEDFPHDVFADLGYESAHHGQGQWNGVAILSKVGLDDVHLDFADGGEPDRDARIIWATCDAVRVASCYVPNGRSIDDEHYTYKLGWLDRLRTDLDTNTSATDDICVVGDFNIAPDDRDVHSPETHVNATHVSDAERAKLADLAEWGLTDVFRDHHDEAGLYSWWDYRDGAFHKRLGMRIDLILASASIRSATQRTFVDRNARKGKLPSDHAPVIADIER
jgi:exodeoxyribonuclease-3